MKNFVEERIAAAALALLVTTAVALIGCKRGVEIHQDTPQATIASLIKVYAANEPQSLQGLIDPAMLRMTSRESACSDARSLEIKCMNEVVAAFERHTPVAPECHGLRTKDCTCGARGNQAADKAGNFVDSDVHRALAGIAGFSPERCEIKSAVDVHGMKELEKLVTFAGDDACGEIDEADKLTAVTINCAAEMTFILREKDASWRVLALETMTEAALSLGASVKQTEDAQKKRQQELNKDLK